MHWLPCRFQGKVSVSVLVLQALLAEIEAMEDPIAALPLIVAYIFAHVHNRLLQAPGRLLAAVLKILALDMPPSVRASLFDYQGLVVEFLTAGPDGSTGTVTERDAGVVDEANEKERAQRIMTELEARLPALKALVRELRGRAGD